MLRGIFGLTTEEVRREWRKLLNEELNDLYSSPNIVRVIKLNMRWAGHVALWGTWEVHTGFWWGKLRERDHLGDPGAGGRKILKWFSESGMGRYGLD